MRKSDPNLGARLCPCTKIVQIDIAAGVTAGLLPCGGGVAGMSLQQVDTYCQEWFTEKHYCKGWHDMHPPISIEPAASPPAPIEQSPTIPMWVPLQTHPDFPGYRGSARLMGTGETGDVAGHHQYPNGDYLVFLLDDWRKVAYVEVPNWAQSPVASAQEPEAPSALTPVPASPHNTMSILTDDPEPDPEPDTSTAALTSSAEPVAESPATMAEPVNEATAAKPLPDTGLPRFEDLFAKLKGLAEPIVLEKPDVSDILSDMPGREGGSSLAWGFNVHILGDWQQCRRRVYLAHVLGTRSRYPQPQFQIGTIYHDCLAFAKRYGLDLWYEPIKYIEERVGATILRDEINIAKAVVQARLKKYGYLDHGPRTNVTLVEKRVDAFTDSVKIPGKTGQFRLHLCGRLDDARTGREGVSHEANTGIPDAHGVPLGGKTIIHDEKTSSMLTRELTEGFGLDFQLSGYGAIVRFGGLEQEFGPLGAAMVTIGVKPDTHRGGVSAVNPDTDIIRVVAPFDERDIMSVWYNEMVPAATSLCHSLATWERGKDLPALDEAWPMCRMNCVGRWGRCDFFDLCAQHFDSPQFMPDRYRTSEQHKLRVLESGDTYFEKVRTASVPGRAKKTGMGTGTGAEDAKLDAKAIGAEVLGKRAYRLLHKIYDGILAGGRSPAWFTADDEAALKTLFHGAEGEGVDEKGALKAGSALLKTIFENIAEGSKEAPIALIYKKADDGTTPMTIDAVLLGKDAASGRAKSPIVRLGGPTGRWTAVSRNLISAEIVKHLLSFANDSSETTK